MAFFRVWLPHQEKVNFMKNMVLIMKAMDLWPCAYDKIKCLLTIPNSSGKSNFYRALRLLAETTQGGVVNALAHDGGLNSTFWAGPAKIYRRNAPRKICNKRGGSQRKCSDTPRFFPEKILDIQFSLGLPAPSSSLTQLVASETGERYSLRSSWKYEPCCHLNYR